MRGESGSNHKERAASMRPLRVGLMVPSSNTVMEIDFHRNLPPERFTVHTARIFLESTTREGEERMINEFVPRASADLKTLLPDIVVFGCTSAGSLYGMAFDRKICSDVGRATGGRAISVLSSVSEELKSAGASRIAVITPYIDELNSTIKRSLEEDGFGVASIDGMSISHNYKIGTVSPSEIVQFAKQKLSKTTAGCIFFSCTNLRAVEALPELKRIFSMPIVTSNQAAIDAVKRAAAQLP